jgi:GDP-fucose protein O-fucosyltransferase
MMKFPPPHGMKPRRITNNHNSNSLVAVVWSTMSGSKWVALCASVICLASVFLFPILILEGMNNKGGATAASHQTSSSLSAQSSSNKISVQHALNSGKAVESVAAAAVSLPARKKKDKPKEPEVIVDGKRVTKDGRRLPVLTLADLDTSMDATMRTKPVARGVAGMPLEQSPATVNAQRAHVECDINVDSLAYWNDPVGTRDSEFTSPFDVYGSDQQQRHEKDEKYISFAPDNGGWNNVRMSMEIIFVIAAVTGRTLVLPPKEPLYLLHHDAQARHRGFADFFPLHTAAFQKRVKVLAFEDFLLREKNGPLQPSSPEELEAVTAAADHCDNRANSNINCKAVYDYLKRVGYHPEVSAVHTCLVFDESMYHGINVTADMADYLQTVCGPHRKQFFWDASMAEPKLLHFRASEKEYRLLAHFYGMIYFTNPAVGHFYKRFVRDFLHYHDQIYCAAGKVVKAVQAEGVTRGFAMDDEGAGAYSALHVRRGDLQYKKVKIPAQEWYDNTKEIWLPKEILYIATDERDKSFFDDLAKHHDLRYLDDYWDLAGLGDIDPNYMGMIDTIVASRGRAFAGTWFSTFSGYINRLRGYHGMSMMDSWYSFLPKKEAVHEWRIVDDFAYAYEWPDGWVGIDADEFPSREKF